MAAIKNRITLEAIDGGVRFTFENCDHYLQNGTIDVPLNSLSLIFDESDMATFRKAASNDIFISAPITYFYGLDTKEDLADFYTENMVGGSGGGGSLEYYSEGEGQALIEVPSNIDGANGVDVFNNGVNIYANEEQVGETSLYVSPTAVTINDDVVVTESALSGKQDTLIAGSGITISGNVISADGGGGSITIDPTLDTGSTNAVANSAITEGFNAYTCRQNTLNGEAKYFYFPSPANPYGDILIRNFSINGRCPLTKSNGTNDYIDKFSLVETSAFTQHLSDYDEAQRVTATAINDLNERFGGMKLRTLTQTQYDALTVKDDNTLYIITNVVNNNA